MVYIGIAGWSIPKEYKEFFPKDGTHLERYSKVLNITEINQTFYKLPRASTFEKWREQTPKNFKFSVKLSREITHYQKLKDVSLLKDFIEGISNLEEKLFSILIQLPPSLKFEKEVAESFFDEFRKLYKKYIAIEPRNESWIEAEELFKKYKISRVAADPARYKADRSPGGDKDFIYYRLHGSPKIYYSEYSTEFLKNLSKEIKNNNAKDTVVIFDNTASGAGIKNAIELKKLIENEIK